MISVIVPVFNSEKYLNQCLDSLLSQTYNDLEIILINDGSSDRSGTICDEYMNRDARVRTFHQANAGASVIRNCGLSLARGEFIGFIGSDDYVDCEMYKKLHSVLIEEESDIAVCNYISLDLLVPRLHDHGSGCRVLDHPEIVSQYINTFYTGEPVGFITLYNKLYRSSLIREKNLRFKNFRRKSGDAFFNLLACFHAGKIAFTPEALYYYTYNPASINHTFERDRLAVSTYNVKEAMEFNERYFHLSINTDAFYRNTIMCAVLVMSDAFILKREDRFEVVKEFYVSGSFHEMIKRDGQLRFLPKLLCWTILNRHLAVATVLVRVIAALRRIKRLIRDGWDAFRKGLGLSGQREIT